ncbi:hypothetical protein FRB97_008619 [Tulasnella sp. 331]|nr:hypothetical protein FRB97_008619 [Tulasnella sp. 331]
MTTDANNFNTLQLLDSEDIPIPAHDLGFPTGLTWLDIDRSAHIRIKAYYDDHTASNVKAHLDAWGDTTPYSAGSTWLDLKELGIDKNHNRRVKTYASNITKTGFTLHIDTGGDTTLYTGTATWLARPANRTNIASVTYNMTDVRAWDAPQVTNAGNPAFGKTFQKTPLVLTAFNWLDIDNNANLRIRALKSDITTSGFTWNLDSWGDTTLYSAGASYLAVQDY